MQCLSSRPKIVFFAAQQLGVNSADCAGRPPGAYKPTVSISARAIASQVGEGIIESVVESQDREDTPLASGRKHLIAMVKTSCDCLLSQPLQSLYAKGDNGLFWRCFGGAIEDVSQYGNYYKIKINPNSKIPEVAQ